MLPEPLKAYLQGHLSQYRQVVAALSVPRGPFQAQLYSEASQCVTLIHPDLKDLVQAIWAFDWGSGPDAVRAYVSFLVHLVSAHGSKFLVKTFKTLVGRLKLRPNEPEGFDEETVRRVSQLIHPAIQKIISVVPGSHEQLSATLIEQFPHSSHSLTIQKLYVENALRVLEYCPLVREKVIPAIIDRLIRIDVEIKLEDFSEVSEDLDSEADGDRTKPNTEDELELFGMDMEGHGHGGPATSHRYSPEEEQRMREHKENAMKLDCLLDLLFNHIQARSFPEREEYFKILMRGFDSIILNTFESKYTQFIFFYFAQLHPQFSTAFISYLSSLLDGSLNSADFSPANKNRRLSAVAYIASFLGRAAFLSPVVVRETISFLARWLHSYLDRHEFDVARTLNIAADAERHGLFYLVTQAALYSFCFKHRVILEDQSAASDSENRPRNRRVAEMTNKWGNDSRFAWVNSLNLERIVESSLNPLIMIQEQVAQEFTNISLNLGIPLGPLCERILQRNKLIVLPTRASFGGDNRLESFFPFDPFMLKVSSKHFKDGYQYWESVQMAEADDEFESSESVHGTPTSGVPIGKRHRASSSAMQMARSLEDGGFSLSYSNSYNPDSEMAMSIGNGGYGSYESHSVSVGQSASPVYHFSAAGFL